MTATGQIRLGQTGKNYVYSEKERFMGTYSDAYIPINCNYYDKLEAWAILKEEVKIHFLDSDGSEKELKGRIVDFFIKEKAEFMKLADEQEIRLDHLLSVNGEAVPNAC